MIEVPIPNEFKVGGFDYQIKCDPKHDRELRSDSDWGQCDSMNKDIYLMSDSSPQQFAQTFLHEIIHAVDNIYCADHLSKDHDTVRGLANGLLQVFEQLGIRFVKGQ